MLEISREWGSLLSWQYPLINLILITSLIWHLSLSLGLRRLRKANAELNRKVRREATQWRKAVIAIIAKQEQGVEESKEKEEKTEEAVPKTVKKINRSLPQGLDEILEQVKNVENAQEVIKQMQKKKPGFWSLLMRLGLWRTVVLIVSTIFALKSAKSIYDDYAPLFQKEEEDNDE